MRLLWLPDKLQAWGLPVVEHPGWQTRGAEFRATPTVVIGHHTATPASAHGDLPTLRILVQGRSDLPGPLCQIGLSRSGVAHVIAAGKANHAGRGAWRGVTNSAATVGVEVEHPGVGPWTPQLLQAFDRTMAALLDGLGQGASHYCGHREWATPAGRKVDPGGVDLDLQRERIARLLLRGPIDSLKTSGEDYAMPPTIRVGDAGRAVRKMQALLAWPHNHPEITNTGVFGPTDREVLIAHQRFHKLDADGICGPDTWRTLIEK